MCILPSASAPVVPTLAARACPAKLLAPHQRQALAVEALTGARPVTHLAADYQVSRQFVYQQVDQAEQALAEAFAPDLAADDSVLFSLPVTEVWLRRLMVALLLLGHSSYRGVSELSEAVAAVARGTVRASSVVENLNSRLRNYFFLRRHLGPDSLQLLQFFLNHRRFLRSEHPERVDHSPAELLTGQGHAHWLELLGLPDPLRN